MKRANDFNPRSPRGERPRYCAAMLSQPRKFQSTLPSRGATHRLQRSYGRVYFNPRSPRGERRLVQAEKDGGYNFNPRSPRGERPPWAVTLTWRGDFNPRSPRGERPPYVPCLEPGAQDFNPRSPRGERPLPLIVQDGAFDISIHAPLAGSDVVNAAPRGVPHSISIHAPLAGSDLCCRTSHLPCCNFNPRSPRGERPIIRWRLREVHNFNPRSPRGERHLRGNGVQPRRTISIHAPLAGSDLTGLCDVDLLPDLFQSTLPSRGATLSK